VTPHDFLRAYSDALPRVGAAQESAQHERLMSDLASGRATPMRRTPTSVLALAALTLGLSMGLGTLWWVGLPDKATLLVELTARVAEQTVPVGTLVQAQDQSPTEIGFSDGSRVELEPRSHVRVVGLARNDAKLTLESGHINAHIKKATGITWTVAAGPYGVRVVGTKFKVDWNSKEGSIRVAVDEGQVQVFGGNIPAPGILLSPGGTFEDSGSASSRAREASEAAKQVKPVTAEIDELVAASPGAELPRGNAAGQGSPNWRDLAREGSYQAALELAKAAGIPQLLSKLGPDDLLLFGNAARLSGDGRVAEEAYRSLRKRFAGKQAATLAAFALGRLATDTQHDTAAATRWFEVFLAESPRGDLAAGARARLMDMHVKAGEFGRASVVARDYLAYHPEGPHKSTARSLVDRAKSSSFEPSP
jgi:hypothetical protein